MQQELTSTCENSKREQFFGSWSHILRETWKGYTEACVESGAVIAGQTGYIHPCT